MLEIWLNKGYFIAKNGKRSIKVELESFILPVSRYEWHLESYLATVKPIELAYQECIKQGLTEDKLIQKLLDIYMPVRYFKAGQFVKEDLVIGLCGHRGGGKSLGAVAICLFDYMFRGLNCWSNLPIAVKVCYGKASRVYRSIDTQQVDLLDLDLGYTGGVLLADECNLEYASAYKAMSGANQDFGAIMQQIRKRHMSIIWTAQSFNSVDRSSVRFQSDFIIQCRDRFNSGEDSIKGNTSNWNIYDIGGLTGKYDFEYELTHRYITDFLVWEGHHYNKPFWPAYNSYELQGGNYVAKYKAAKAKKLTINEQQMAETENRMDEYIAVNLFAPGIARFWADSFWKNQNIENNPSAQALWGKAFARNGYVRKRNGKYFYELQDMLEERT